MLDVIDKEQFSFTRKRHRVGSEEQSIELEEQSRQAAKEWVTNEELSSMSTSSKEFKKIDGNTTSLSRNGIKANAWLQVYQDNDLTLGNMQLKILGLPYDEVLLNTDNQYNYYKANESRKKT